MPADPLDLLNEIDGAAAPGAMPVPRPLSQVGLGGLGARGMTGVSRAADIAAAAGRIIEDPEAAARSYVISRQTGLPAFGLGDDPLAARSARARELASLADANPRLGEWLSNDQNLAVAIDDAEQLSGWERATRWAGRALTFKRTRQRIERGDINLRLGRMQHRIAAEGGRAATPAENAYEMILESRLQELERELRPGDDAGLLGAVAEQLPLWGYSMMEGGKALASYSELAAELRERGELSGEDEAGVTLEAFIEGGAAMTRAMQQIESGLAFNEYADFRTVDGRPIDRAVAARAALEYGTLAAALEFLELQGVVGSLGLASMLRRGGTNITRRHAMRQVLERYGIVVATGAATGGLQEALQEGAQIAAGERAKLAVPGMVFAPIGERERAGRIQEAAIMGLATGGGFSLAFSAPGIAADTVAVARSLENQRFFNGLADGATNSKLAQRAPEAFRDAVQAMTQGTPVETIRIDAAGFVEHYQSIHENPLDVMDRLGVPRAQLQQALAAHGDIEVPTSSYAAVVAATPDHNALVKHMRLDPNDFTQNELDRAQSRIREIVDGLAEQADAIAQDNDIGSAIETRVRELLDEAYRDGGTNPAVNARYARLYAALPRAIMAMARKGSGDYAQRTEAFLRNLFAEDFDVMGPVRAEGLASPPLPVGDARTRIQEMIDEEERADAAELEQVPQTGSSSAGALALPADVELVGRNRGSIGLARYRYAPPQAPRGIEWNFVIEPDAGSKDGLFSIQMQLKQNGRPVPIERALGNASPEEAFAIYRALQDTLFADAAAFQRPGYYITGLGRLKGFHEQLAARAARQGGLPVGYEFVPAEGRREARIVRAREAIPEGGDAFPEGMFQSAFDDDAPSDARATGRNALGRRDPPAQIPDPGTREWTQAVKAAKAAQKKGERLTPVQRALLRWDEEGSLGQSSIYDLADQGSRQNWYETAGSVIDAPIPGEAPDSRQYGFALDDGEIVTVEIAPDPAGAASISWTFLGRTIAHGDPYAKGAEAFSVRQNGQILSRVIAILEADIAAHGRDAYVYTPASPAHERVYRAIVNRLAGSLPYSAVERDGDVFLVRDGARVKRDGSIAPAPENAGRDPGVWEQLDDGEIQARQQAYHDRLVAQLRPARGNRSAGGRADGGGGSAEPSGGVSGTERAGGEGELAQSREIDALGFRSVALEAAQALPSRNMRGEEAVNRILKARGVDGFTGRVADEVDFLGLREEFGSRKSVSKEEIIDYIRTFRLVLEEKWNRFDPKNEAMRPVDPNRRWLAALDEQTREREGFGGVYFETREQAERWLSGRGFAGEARYVGLREDGPTRSGIRRGPGDLRLPGDEPVFELRIKIPEGLPGSDFESHWSRPPSNDKGVLVSIRGEERIDDQGKRTLFGGEVQSDLAQSARALKDRLDAARADVASKQETLDRLGGPLTPEEAALMEETRQGARESEASDILIVNRRTAAYTLAQARSHLEALEQQGSAQLNAPLASKTSSWTGAAVRALVYRAARDGFDSVSFPTGETSALIQGNDAAAAHYDTNVKGAAQKIARAFGVELREGGVRWSGSDKRTRDLLDDDIVAQIENDGNQASAYVLPITPEMRARILKEGMPLFQGQSQEGRRGSIKPQLTPDGDIQAATIRLFEASDLSTFLHESGHLFRFILGTVARDPDAPVELQKMWSDTLQWFGVSEAQWDAMSFEERVPFEEQWARTFEAYLMEGRAPSLSLREAFAAFKAWLVQIYRTVMRLDANLTPEIRDVFDRLLATEQEMAEARAAAGVDRGAFATAEEAGMSEEAFAQYQEAIAGAREAQEAELRARVMETYTRQQKRWWRSEAARVRSTVIRDVDADPARRAHDWLAFGEWRDLPVETDEAGAPVVQTASENEIAERPEGLPDMRLSAEALADEYGPEIFAELPKALRPARAEDVDAILSEAMALKKQGKVRRAQRLSAFVRALGGVKDEGGEIVQALGDPRLRPGLINNKTGRSLDEIALAAYEAGYFGRVAPGQGLSQRGQFGFDPHGHAYEASVAEERPRVEELLADLGVTPEQALAIVRREFDGGKLNSTEKKARDALITYDIRAARTLRPPVMDWQRFTRRESPFFGELSQSNSPVPSPEDYARLRARVAELEEELRTDALTGLRNQRAFDEDVALGWPVVGAMDMDGLKRLNDAVGHEGADGVIRALAGVLLSAQANDVRFYRRSRSGDEFAARFSANSDAEAVLRDLQQRLENVRIEFDLDGVPHVYEGIGISVGWGDSYANADQAAYADKQVRLEAGTREDARQPGPPRRLRRNSEGQNQQRATGEPGELAQSTIPSARSSGYQGSDTGELFQFAGQYARGADMSAFRQALQMKHDGVDPEFIHQDTGWFEGVDGEWRFEIDDSQARIKTLGAKPLHLGAVLEHAALFRAYPELRNGIRVRLTHFGDGETVAEYAPTKGAGDVPRIADRILGKNMGEIRLQRGISRHAMLSALLHEIQHVIQARENFAIGAPVGESNYRVSAGEVEARNVQARINMTDIQRWSSFPLSTQDTPESHQVVTRFDEVEHAFFHASREGYQGSVNRFLFSPSGASPDAIAQALRSAYGRDAQRLFDAGKTEIIGSVNDLARITGQPIPADVKGAFDPKTGKTYIVAENVTEAEASRILLHEVGGHTGMRDMLGAKLYAQLMRDIEALVEADNPIAKAARERVDSLVEAGLMRAKDAPEETMTYLVESAPDLPLVRRLLAQIRQWLWRTFDGAEWIGRLSVEDIRALAVASLRRVARAEERAVRGERVAFIGEPLNGREVLASAGREGYEGADTGEAIEWLRAVRKYGREGMVWENADGSDGPRKTRAREQGFDVETPLYHGTNSVFSEFDLATASSVGGGVSERPAIWLTPHPEAADDFARYAAGQAPGTRSRVMGDLVVRGRIKDVDLGDVAQLDGSIARALDEAAVEGFDGALLRGIDERLVSGPAARADQIAVFDPRNIRSRFAAFDPDYSESANLLASAGREGYQGTDTGEAIEWLRAKAKGLPMDEASRMARAREMGFNTEEILYHGTGRALRGGAILPTGTPMLTEPRGISLSADVGVANEFAEHTRHDSKSVYPVFVRGPLARNAEFERIMNSYRGDGDPGPQFGDRSMASWYKSQTLGGKSWHEARRLAQEELERQGYTGVRYGWDEAEVSIFHPRNIRSRFAAFDPDYSESANLLAQDPPSERPTPSEFLDALIADLRNERAVYSIKDQEAVSSNQEREDAIRWFEARGIDLSKSKDELRADIAAMLEREDTREDAVHPDIAASWFGFESGDALIQALRSLKPRAKAIEDGVRERLEAEYGDVMKDGTVAEAARLAANTEAQVNVLEIELAAIERAAGGRTTPVNRAARQYAETAVQRMSVKEVRGYDKFLAGERRAARNAMDLLAKGKHAEAAIQKSRQIASLWLYRFAREAADEADRAQRYFKKFERASVRENIAPQHLDRIDEALENVDLRVKPRLSGARRASLQDWIASMTEQGLEHMIDPSALEVLGRRPFETLTVEEARSLRDAVRNFEHIGRRWKEVLLERDKRQFGELVSDLVTQIESVGQLTNDQIKGLSPTAMEAANALRLKAHAEHVKPEFLFRLLDGLEDSGPVWRAFFAPIARAEDAELTMRNASAARLSGIFSVYTRKERARLFRSKRYIPEILMPLTKAEMLSVALNWGNEGNRQALVDGYGWSERQVDAVLSKLDERDWGVVQAIFDWLEEYRAPSFDLQERLTGVRPEAVEAAPIATRYGEKRGGYYPLRYRTDTSEKAFRREDKTRTLEEWGSNWIRPQTRKGHLIERVGSGGQKVRLDMGVLTEHVENVIHDITHREAVIHGVRLLNDERMQEAMKGAVGREAFRVLRPWLARVASDIKDPTTVLEKTLLRLRMGAQVVNMGWKISTAIVQPLGYLNAVPRVGAGQVLKQALAFLGNPVGMKSKLEFVFSRSTFMRNRMGTFDRDVRDAVNRLKGRADSDPLPLGVRQSMFWLTGAMDMGVSVPTWLGAYENARAGKVKNIDPADETAAIERADSVVRMTQGAGGVKDQAEISGSKREIMRLFTMFYSYFSVLYNQLYTEQGPGVREGRISQTAFVVNMMLLWFLPATLSLMLQDRFDKEEDEEDRDWAVRIGKEIGLYPLASIIGVRDLVNAIGSRYDYEITPVTEALERTAGAGNRLGQIGLKLVDGEDIEDREIRSAMKDASLALGYWFGLPARQAWTTGEYAFDVMTGEEPSPIEDPARAYNEGLLRDTE